MTALGRGFWLSVNSTNKSATDYTLSRPNPTQDERRWKGAVELSADGRNWQGGMVEAKTTPHMYVIDPKWQDSFMPAESMTSARQPGGRQDVVRKNFVRAARTETLAGWRGRWPLQPHGSRKASRIRKRYLAS